MMQYTVKRHLNENVVELGVRFVVPGCYEIGREFHRWNDSATPEQKEFIERVAAVPGVEYVNSHNKYTFSVWKGAAFAWGEILPVITQLINEHTGDTSVENRQPRGVRIAEHSQKAGGSGTS